MRCGAPMFAKPRDPPFRIGVSIATCDDRNAIAPDCHIWVSEKVGWMTLDDELPQFSEGWTAGEAWNKKRRRGRPRRRSIPSNRC